MVQRTLRIIGAGSLGLILASKLTKKFDEIIVFESSQSLGGITRDYQSPSGSIYYSGCQYLHGSYLPEWALQSTQLQQFQHHYASLTEQNRSWNYKADFAGPSFRIGEIKIEKKIKNVKSLSDRLSLYPIEISELLDQHIKKFLPVDSKSLHVSGATSLGFTRVASTDSDLELAQLKLKNTMIDDLYGVSKKTLGQDFEISYLPKSGYSKFWLDFAQELQSQYQVKIELNSRIEKKILLSDNMIRVTEPKAWCADPRQLIQVVANKRLDSYSSLIHSFGLVLESYTGPKLPFYINIFSSNNPCVRLFFYELGAEVKLTVDALKRFDSIDEIHRQIIKLTSEARIDIKIGKIEFGYWKSRRYFPVSLGDYKVLKRTSKALRNSNWLDSGTYLFDRKARLLLMLDQI